MKRNDAVTKNYEWYIKTDTTKFAGKWIAIVNCKIVSFGDSADIVYREAKKKYPKDKPSLAKVPDKEILVLHIKRW